MSSNKNYPKISVLMPVYNAGHFLVSALDSILVQTFPDFELIAIDDGSSDESGKILDEYATRDSRVRVVHRENKGLVASLNEAIELSRGEYLARQDADDTSFPIRFERQVDVLNTHPDVVLVAGGFEVFDEDDEYLYREVLPTADEDIKRAMYLRNPIGHGSVMFRKSAVIKVGSYSNECGPTEDYELWNRLAKVGKFHAIEAATYHWRVNMAGITSTQNDRQLSVMKQHINTRWAELLPPVIPSSVLRKKGAHYYHTYPKRGIAMKNMMLADNAQLAIKMIRRGKLLSGTRQMISVMLVGRSGVRAVHYRFHAIQKGTAGAIRRHAKVGRRDASTAEVES